MANNYPTSLNTHKKDWANTTPVADTHPEEHNDIAGAVEALEVKVGINDSTATDNTVLRGTGAGASGWGQLDAGDIATASKTGDDTKVVTGTEGSGDEIVVWNADGDAVASTVSSDTPISVSSGAISIDGDQLDIDFTPSNYTPDSATPAEASDDDDLTAHLQGIDTALGSGGGSAELFITPISGNSGAGVDIGGFGYETLGNGATTRFNVKVPSDFTSLTDVFVVCIADATETVQWDLEVNFGAAGEVYTTNANTVTNDTQSVTANEIEELDIDDGSVFSGLATGDYLGVEFISNIDNIRVIGLRFVYAT